MASAEVRNIRISQTFENFEVLKSKIKVHQIPSRSILNDLIFDVSIFSRHRSSKNTYQSSTFARVALSALSSPEFRAMRRN